METPTPDESYQQNVETGAFRLFRLLRGDSNTPDKEAEMWPFVSFLVHLLMTLIGVGLAIYQARVPEIMFRIVLWCVLFSAFFDALSILKMNSVFVLVALHVDVVMVVSTSSCALGWSSWALSMWLVGILSFVLCLFALTLFLQYVRTPNPYTPDAERRARDWRRMQRMLHRLIERSPRAGDLLARQNEPRQCDPSSKTRLPCCTHAASLASLASWILLRVVCLLLAAPYLCLSPRLLVAPNQWTIFLSLCLLADSILCWTGLPPWAAVWSSVSQALMVCMLSVVASNGSGGGLAAMIYVGASSVLGIAFAGVWLHFIVLATAEDVAKDPRPPPTFKSSLMEWFAESRATKGKLPTRAQVDQFIDTWMRDSQVLHARRRRRRE